MILDEDIERRLRYLLDNAWAAGDDRFPDRIIANFKNKCLDGEFSEKDITYTIQQRYPWYGSQAEPEQVAPESLCSAQPSEVKNETSTPAKIPRTWKQKYGKRQAKKEATKEAIVYWLNEPEQGNHGCRVTEIMDKITTFTVDIKERMFRNYMEELFAEGKVKRWVKPVTLPGGKQIRHHYYAGAKIKNPYYKWVDEA